MKDNFVFPRVEGQAPGLELRDLFAAFALAGLANVFSTEFGSKWSEDDCAEEAYALADAMLEQRGE